jgi:hypothetical protein
MSRRVRWFLSVARQNMSNDRATNRWHYGQWMQPVDNFNLTLGILWSLFTLYGISLFLPFMDRRLRECEIKSKGIKGTLAAPSRLQLVIFLLLTSLMTAVAMSDAFHRDLRATIGISSAVACSLMMILPALYFALGWLKKRHKNGQGFEK